MRLRASSLALFVFAALSGWSLSASAQLAGAGPPGTVGPANGRAQAPFDPSGYWVALVTQDWRYRMVVPGPGQYSGIPLNLAAKQFADNWKAADYSAAGKECAAYGAPALMMLPTRLHISWQDDNTLRVKTDAGQQTRLLHFSDAAPGAASLQGDSKAQWLTPAPTFGFGGGFGGGGGGGPGGPGGPGAGAASSPQYGVLRVSTTNLLAGLLRKNGVPYSDKTTLLEDWMLNSLPDGADYLTVSILIRDPVYLRGDYYLAPVFVRESDASKWQPAPCTLMSAR